MVEVQKLGERKVARLIPVVIFDRGKYHDAAIYKTAPEPMALEAGTVYEILRKGESQGFFTVQSSQRAASGWYALGSWEEPVKSPAPEQAPSQAPLVVPSDDDDPERPRLKRGGSEDRRAPGASDTSSAGNAPIATAPAPPRIDERATAEADADPERPRLKRGRPAPQAESTITPSLLPGEEPSDPDRPVLKRGRREPEQAPAPQDWRTDSQPTELLVAVSDAEVTDTKPYSFSWSDEERDKHTAALLRIAEQAMEQTFGASQTAAAPVPRARGNQRRGPAPRPALPRGTWVESGVTAFDLEMDNAGELVFSGRYAPANGGPVRHVTVVARTVPDGTLRTMLTRVTDATRLDRAPRLELVDAVDAEGDGRAELLFRESNSDGPRWSLWRFGRDVVQLF